MLGPLNPLEPVAASVAHPQPAVWCMVVPAQLPLQCPFSHAARGAPRLAFDGVTTMTEFELPTVVVTPGEEATTKLTVRNDSDIVEAYEFEVLGECAQWTTVEPARLSLYPGTAEQVTVVLRPPRSPDVRAGEEPLGIRVLPAEQPQTTVVCRNNRHHRAFWPAVGQTCAASAPGLARCPLPG